MKKVANSLAREFYQLMVLVQVGWKRKFCFLTDGCLVISLQAVMSQNLNAHFEDDSTRNSLELSSWHLTQSLENEASNLKKYF